MSTIRFRAGDISLELSGSEAFVTRQLLLLAPLLGEVDTKALGDPLGPTPPAGEAEHAPAASEVSEPSASGDGRAARAPENGDPDGEEPDEFLSFYRSFRPAGRDRQSDAALLFSYYLQRREGLDSLGLGDLIRCCIRAGVDTRNFNRALGTLTRRGFLETVRPGHAYRISERGVAAVESRM